MPLYLDTYLHIFVWIFSMKDENDNKIELCQPLGSEHCGGGAGSLFFEKRTGGLGSAIKNTHRQF
jgi:hypothetical protein